MAQTLVSEKMRSLLKKLFIESSLSPRIDQSKHTLPGKPGQPMPSPDSLASFTVLDDIMNATPAAARVLISYTLGERTQTLRMATNDVQIHRFNTCPGKSLLASPLKKR